MKSAAFESAKAKVKAKAKVRVRARAKAKAKARVKARVRVKAKATFFAVSLCQSSFVRFLAMHHAREYPKIPTTPIMIAHSSHGTDSMSPVIVPAAELHHPVNADQMFAAVEEVAPRYAQ